MIETEINKVACNVKTDSHRLPCGSCSNSIKSQLKTAITMRRGFHDLVAQQFSTTFSAGCYFSD